jgi:hypothetical protein
MSSRNQLQGTASLEPASLNQFHGTSPKEPFLGNMLQGGETVQTIDDRYYTVECFLVVLSTAQLAVVQPRHWVEDKLYTRKYIYLLYVKKRVRNNVH